MIDCEEFRANYDKWSVREMQEFHSRIYAEFPDQTHHSYEPLRAMLSEFQPRRVLELGGWDGTAAARALSEHAFIETWCNVEVCREAVANGYSGERYEAVAPARWFWEYEWEADAFVAMHSIEHLRARDLRAAIEAVACPTLFFEAPLMDHAVDWAQSPTTHILEVGWGGVDEICADLGYRLVRRKAHRLPERSGGFSYTATYQEVAA